jgi:hypothetical protein
MQNTPLHDAVDAWVLEDRQWPKRLRISNARLGLQNAPTEFAKKFWRTVLKRNGAKA